MKILIIDNSMVMIKLMDNLLKKEGHHVKSAYDAFSALDTLKDFTPDIIFIDLIMPKISGDILCRMIRAIPHLINCYIVIISATLAEQQLNLEEIGANGAIVKVPFVIMSKYILETIAESKENTPRAKPETKGKEEIAPRYITHELLSQNKHLQKLLENMSQGVLELENNRVLYANSTAEIILRVKKEKLLGSYLSEILDIEIWQTLGPQISTCTNSSPDEERNTPVELHGRHIILQCIRFEQNRQKRIVLLNDITERRRMESVAEAANLTNNLGYIFSGIRHEIGNPVNSIKIALTVLQKNLTQYDKSTIGEFVDRSLEEVMRLEYLLRALKNYSLFEKPDVQPVRMGQFMENFLPLIQGDLEKRQIDIRTRIDRDEMIALTDTRALHHVILNLVTNAADAVMAKKEPYITITVTRKSPRILIKVDDNGCGIADNDMANLFKPFFTSKPEGTGLGLVIVQKMLFSMNSNISIESIRDFGTTVTISLPEVD
jgi:nitrogen fixation/metabolism regulation signal transduction histidine kinase